MPVETSKKASGNTARPVVSRSTILILSGFLTGLATSKGLTPSTQLWVLTAAGLGLISFFVLDCLSRARQEAAALKAQKRAVLQLERRMDRHLTREGHEPGGAADPRRDLVLQAVMSQRS